MSVLLDLINTAALVLAIAVTVVFVISSIALVFVSDAPEPPSPSGAEGRPGAVISIGVAAEPGTAPAPTSESPLKAA